jgi:dTDP-4-amino-4,6-dideoxygalactose transaminase
VKLGQNVTIYPVHLQPAYAHLGYGIGDFPVAEGVAGKYLSLPIYAELTEEQQDYITHVLKQALEKSCHSMLQLR